MVTKGSSIDHLDVTAVPDTIRYSEVSVIKVQAKSTEGKDVVPDKDAQVNIVLKEDEPLGVLLYGGVGGNAIPGVPYADAKSGKVVFAATLNNPVGKDPQPVQIGVTQAGNETIDGFDTVVVRCKFDISIEMKQYDGSWGNVDYDHYVERIDTIRRGRVIRRIDTTYYSIRRKGCALTAFAMMLTHFGIMETSASLISKMTPDYVSNKGPIDWTFAGTYATLKFKREDGFFPPAVRDSATKHKLKTKDGKKDSVDFTKAREVPLNHLDDLLLRCTPVAVLVLNPAYNSNHFVVVVDKAGPDYVILDPGGNHNRLSYYGNKIYGMRYLVQ